MTHNEPKTAPLYQLQWQTIMLLR